MRNKTPEWKVDDQIVQSEHPPLRNISFSHDNLEIPAAPFKLPQDNDDSKNLKYIVLQNNFSNINLQTIGKQLTRIETKIQQPTVLHHSVVKSSESVKLPEQELKTPVFKPF